MKSLLIAMLSLMLGGPVFTQVPSEGIPISIGYFSFLGYQPGAKLGTHFNLRNLSAETGRSTEQRSFFVSPQVGFFTRPNVHISYLANVDFGYKKVKNHKRKYSAWSIGAGYLNQSQITGWQVRLADGSKEKVRENWAWFLPTLNYEFGKAINEHITWYSKFSYGMKIASARENAAIFFIELGLEFPLMR